MSMFDQFLGGLSLGHQEGVGLFFVLGGVPAKGQMIRCGTWGRTRIFWWVGSPVKLKKARVKELDPPIASDLFFPLVGFKGYCITLLEICCWFFHFFLAALTKWKSWMGVGNS